MFTNRPARATASARVGVAIASLALALCALVSADESVAAESLSATDRRAIEHTVRKQLDAFVHDDAEVAFGFATPDIRRLFGSSDNFMRMVRENYEPVYRPDSVRFVRVEAVGGQWVQVVQLVDEAGQVWRALFTMKRQADRSWKVGGCRLVQTRETAT